MSSGLTLRIRAIRGRLLPVQAHSHAVRPRGQDERFGTTISSLRSLYANVNPMACNGKHLVSKLQFSILARRRCQDFSAATALEIERCVPPILPHPRLALFDLQVGLLELLPPEWKRG